MTPFSRELCNRSLENRVTITSKRRILSFVFAVICSSKSLLIRFCERWKLAYEKNIKHRILRRRFFLVLKPLHAMFYGQWAYELLMILEKGI